MPPTVDVAVGSPRTDGVATLLQLGAAYAESLYPAESCFMLDVDELEQPNVSFYLARVDGTLVGTAALVDGGDGRAELKRMFVYRSARGSGVAGALLRTIESDAATVGIGEIVLETGTLHTAAQSLYTKHGYREIPLFGQYVGEQFSICMSKSIELAQNRQSV